MFSKKRATAAIAVATGAALALAGCSGSSDTADTYDPNEEVTLDLAFWGNDVRAALYDEAIAAFEEEYPNITVNSSFLGFPEFWEKRQTEAAGGNLPDVMQFDYSYMRQYSQNNLLLDLDPYLGGIIETDALPENVLSIGVVDGVTTGLATSTNAWGMYTNPTLLSNVGVDEFAGGSWEDYNDWMAEVTAAGDGEVWGGTDWTGRIQNFEIQLRANGGELFNEDGAAGFDEEDLAAFWEQGDGIRADGTVIAQQKLEEVYPLSSFDSALTASELTWDNFGSGYLGNLGEAYPELGLIEPPITVEGSQDLYLKPSMLHTISSSTEHPEAAATLVNFLVNSPESGRIFGTNRGLPASETALAGADLDPLSQQIADYEASIEDRLGDAPPVPIVGFGSLEEKFRVLGTELGFGTVTVDDAVDQFFTEMDVVLNS
ncbi:multiple sugar transport system substrate-binding protein [Microbacterium halimionae]|uniref:Multiple sugar transport system substrate-binding protein n=1 Tax=Microbacterium halimionae TaxID=1526413 RepID=A0A7W3PMJ5_9MICO|nr:extracellular solute-binding protein [Microbacterium halimionae]MBA8817243.1 multiple sugar transport system substrate-binding protein [Microbacterium halimionae]NII94693.1 multiple sugar transport system substrate-binding protein [Microbacterium halimionae]